MKFRIPLATVVAALLILASAAQARIGETEQEITARYGKGTKPEDGYRGLCAIPPTSTLQFVKDGVNVQVAFADGRSVAEAYWKVDGSELTAQEIETLKEANKGKAKWFSLGDNAERVHFGLDDLTATCTYTRSTRVFDIRAEKTGGKPMSGF